MFKAAGAVFIALTCFTICGYAQNEGGIAHHDIRAGTIRYRQDELNGSYLKGYFSDIRGIMTSPVHWNGRQWTKVAIVAGVAASLYPLDSETREESQESRNSFNDTVSRVFRSFGEPQYTALPLGALYLYGHLQGDGRARETALLGLESLVLSGVTTGIIKNLAHRDRPSSGQPYNIWHGPELSPHDLSFPSGHSTEAFALATVIANEYGDKKCIPPLAYGIASMTALSRVHDNAHWLSDIFVGSAIGYFTAKAVLHRHGVGKTSILPSTDGKQVGILIEHPY